MEVAHWRAQLIAGAAIWCTRGRHTILDGRCEALSGLGGTDGNVIFCFEGGRGDAMRATAEQIRSSPVPAVAIVGAEALGWVQIFVDCDLVCVGVSAFMHLDAGRVGPGGRDGGVRRLNAEDLPEARAVVAAAYAEGSPMSGIALPDAAVGSAAWGLWGLEVDGSLASVVTTSTVGDTTGIWSMSTPGRLQRRGHGRRLLAAVLAEMAGAGTRHFLLYASPSGEHLYRAGGFEVIEHWQEWSRPRWIPGRT